MALTKINTNLIANNTIALTNIADNAIDATKIANNQILARHIAAGSISDQLAAAQPTITSLGTLTSLTGGTGDLNWDSGTLFVDSSANEVGIGNTSPGTTLDVTGYIWTNPADGLHSGINFRQAGTFKGWVGYNDSTDVVNLSMDGSIAAGINVSSGGEIGIGTTGCKATLDIKPDNNSWEGGILIQHDNANTGWNIHPERTRSSLWFGYNADTSQALTSQGASEVMHLMSTGKVGIGTNDPAELLHVNSAGSNVVAKFESTDGTGAIMLADNGGSVELAAVGNDFHVMNGGAAAHFAVLDSGYASFTGASDLRVTFGSQGTAGNNDANWVRGNGTTLSYNSASGDHIWEVGGSEKMRLDSAGNVGIGHNDPESSLEVGGTGIQINDGTAGTTPKLVFGTEPSTNAAAKCIFMNSYWLTLQGHRNEGIKMHGVNASGTVQEFLRLTGDNNSDASEAHFYSGGGGQVAINNNAPAGILHVDGHTGSLPTILEGSGNGDEVKLQLLVKANNGSTSTQGLYTAAGSTSADNTICLGTDSDNGVMVRPNGNVQIGLGGSGGDLIMQPLAKVYLDAGGDTYIQESAGNVMDFYCGGNRKMRLNPDGLLFGTDTAAANALHDYEEGTWTAALKDSSQTAATMSISTCHYTKIGRMVYIYGQLRTSSTSGLSGDIRIYGLPFTAYGGWDSTSGVTINHAAYMNITANQVISAWVHNAGTYFDVSIWDSASGSSYMDISEWSSDGQIMFSGFYATSA